MTSSVVYQETKNNFSNIKQTINNQQIVSVKLYPDVAPDSHPDYIGQLALCSDPSGRPMVYIGSLSGLGINGWDLVSFSGDSGLPDAVVMEDRPNDFSDMNQTINGAQIAFMTYGSRSENLEPIQGEGHIYIRQDNPTSPKMFVAVDDGGGCKWREIKVSFDGNLESVVYKDKANDFTHEDQKIGGHPIATLWTGSKSPIDLGYKPTKAGQFFLQLSESSGDKKAHMWVSVNAASATDFKWEYIDSGTGSSSLPATVVQTDKTNNFQPYEQKICGKQIVSAIDGGDKTPAQSGIRPDYEGQLYYAALTEPGGTKNMSYWFSYKNSWQPLLSGLDKIFASLSHSNHFSNPVQILGELADNRFITGARVKRGALAPDKDAKWKATLEGEITVYQNSAVTPIQNSVWVAVNVNTGSNNTGEWVCIWSSTSALDPNIAFVNKQNTFLPGQKMGVSTTIGKLVASRFGTNPPKTQRLVPMVDGEIYIQNNEDKQKTKVWMAMRESDTDSWVEIPTGILSSEYAKLTNANLFVKGQAMGTTAEHVELVGARRGGDVPLGNIIPMSTGEIYIQAIRDSYDYNIFIATEGNNSATWKKIFSTLNTEGALLPRVEQLEQGYVAHDNQITELEKETKDIATAFQGIEEAFNKMGKDLTDVKNNLNELGDELSEKIVAIEQLVEILEKKNQEILTELDGIQQKVHTAITKATYAEKCFSEHLRGFLDPNAFKIVDHLGQIYLQDGEYEQDVWMGVEVGKSYWVKLTNNL